MSEPRTTAPMWSAAPPVHEAMTLEELSLLLGALKPEAVCRIAREVARALARVHAEAPGADGALSSSRVVIDVAGRVVLSPLLDSTGGLLRVDEPRLVPPERRGTAYAAEPGDDLYALGVLVAEAALGHPLDAPSGYLDLRVLEGAIPGRLLDAIAALVAPPQRRLTNAAAAQRVFADLEPRYGDGARALAKLVEHARLGAAFGGLGATLDDGADAEGPITIPDPPSAAAPPPQDPLAIGPLRKHEIAFFARGIVIAPAPAPARKRARSSAWRGATLGATLGAVVVAAFVALQSQGALTSARGAPVVAAPATDATVVAAPVVAPVVAPPVVAPAAEAPVVAAAAVEPMARETDDDLVIGSPVVTPASAPSPIESAPIEAAPVEEAPAKAEPVNAEAVKAERAKAAPAKAAPAKPAIAKPAIAKPAIAKPAPAKPAPAKPAPAKSARTVDEPALGAATDAAEVEGPAVKLVVDGSAAMRAKAEAALRACAIEGPVLGALEVKNRKVVKVTSDPPNACVARVLKRTLGGYSEDQPFEIELR